MSHMRWCPITDENEGKTSWASAGNAVQSEMTDETEAASHTAQRC